MRTVIPYGKQFINNEDIQAVVETLQSDYLTQGPKIAEFEKAFAKYVGSKHAVAVSNGTAALHLSVLALGLQPGEKVITTPITFSASANCVRYCGGDVVFADIDPQTYLLDARKVEEILKCHPKGTYKGIIPVDFGGRAVNLEVFKRIADEYGCWIIEDSCHAPGGYFFDSTGQRQFCGNGSFATCSIFSFHPVKHIATGEGGMITTNDDKIYNKLLLLRTHGITRDSSLYTNSLSVAAGQPTNEYPGWYMEMQTLGFNYRLSDFQAALGLSQLNRADDGLSRRRNIAAAYNEGFKDSHFIKGQSGVIDGHAYHLYVIETEKRLALYNHLRENNIFAQIHYFPVHMMPYYKQFGWKKNDMPNAELYYDRCISLPMYPTLMEEQQQFVIDTIKSFLQ